MSHPLYTISFWADAIERAISTAAVAALSILGISAFDWLSAPWYATAGAAGMGFVLDLLRSIAAARSGNPGTAGFSVAVEASEDPTLISRLTSAGRHARTDGN